MSVTYCYAGQLTSEQRLYHFLQSCQQRCVATGESFIVSIRQPLSLVDPLAVLQRLILPHQRHFYWHRPPLACEGMIASRIAAWGSCQEETFQGNQRFQKSQAFINHCQQQIIEIKSDQFQETGVNFFTNFTFFDTPSLSCPFPAVTIFIPQWQVTQYKNSCFLTANFTVSTTTNIFKIQKKIIKQKQSIEQVTDSILTVSYHLCSPWENKELREPNQFKHAVNLALNDISSHQLTKIVLAHHFDVVSQLPFDPFLSLHDLRQKHPDCYIFSVGNGNGTTFVGATPERLFSLKKQQLISDALAGSAPRGNNAIADEKFAKMLLNSEKEKREHQAVSNYLIQQLQQLGLTPARSRSQLLKLSNIQHLWTLIQAEVPNQIHPIEIVKKLHPTPAVAGVPTATACEKIQDYETFDRALYAAPIGWLDNQGNAEFLVGIRSAMIHKHQARLYAGAGIVEGSNPDKELAEVQLKLQAMLKSLK